MKKKKNRNFAELNKEPRLIRKEKVSWELRKDVINIVNTRIGLSNVNSESVKDGLVNSDINSTILPRSDNEQILNPQKRSLKFKVLKQHQPIRRKTYLETVLLMPIFLVMFFVNFYV